MSHTAHHLRGFYVAKRNKNVSRSCLVSTNVLNTLLLLKAVAIEFESTRPDN